MICHIFQCAIRAMICCGWLLERDGTGQSRYLWCWPFYDSWCGEEWAKEQARSFFWLLLLLIDPRKILLMSCVLLLFVRSKIKSDFEKLWFVGELIFGRVRTKSKTKKS